MKDPRRQLGDQGEDLAAAALKKQGYKILERNYMTPLGEIDLIARQGKVSGPVYPPLRLAGRPQFKESIKEYFPPLAEFTRLWLSGGLYAIVTLT